MDETRFRRISAAVEGSVDAVVARRLIMEVGGIPGPVYGEKGKLFLRDKLMAYNQAARLSPWLIMVDLDHDEQCAAALRRSWVPHQAPWMCFRVAVRQVESWLLADRECLSAFLRVAIAEVPLHPDTLDDPKRVLVKLARESSRRDIKEDMVPRSGSGRRVGPAYVSRLIEFISGPAPGWRPTVAARSSDSLNRSLQCLKRLIEEFPWSPHPHGSR